MNLVRKSTVEEPIVCVVDGDPAVRDSLQYLCDSNGFSAMGFATQAAFLRMLDQTQADLLRCVICEAQLPDGGGVELFETLKQRGFNLPFALMVSRSSVAAAKHASQAGIEYVLPKPLVDRSPLISFLSS